MDETPVVTVFLRHRGAVLLLRRSDAVGSYVGKWGAVTGHAEGDPDAAADREIREETGLDPDAATRVRAGEPFTVEDADYGTLWVVHPYLYDVDTRDVQPNEETSEIAWVAPPSILRRETVPELWQSYDRVRPTVETVASDEAHGSAALSVRALAVLRDEAALVATDHPDAREGWEALTALAEALVAARPSMAVVSTRIDRAVTEALEAPTGRAAALETAATAGIADAFAADDRAAKRAATYLESRDCRRVATLSRSGTVLAALDSLAPEAVLVAESRPGGEGIEVGTALAGEGSEGPAVTLTTDAAFGGQLEVWDADGVLVGADTVLADGRVINKVGTRAAALAAAHEDVPLVVAAARDKISPAESVDFEGDEGGELREAARGADTATLSVANPTFEATPPALVTAVVTEEGALETAEAVGSVAAERGALADWRRE